MVTMEAQGWRPCQEAQTPRMEVTGDIGKKGGNSIWRQVARKRPMPCHDIICVHRAARMPRWCQGASARWPPRWQAAKMATGGLWRLSSASRHGQGPKAPLSAGSLAGSGLPYHHVWPRHNTMV